MTCITGAAGSGIDSYTHEYGPSGDGARAAARLPQDVSKLAAINLITRYLRLRGATAGEEKAFRTIADRTQREAWHSHRVSPVCWRRQAAMAKELNISERQMRNHERRLAAFGVLRRATADNGWRGRASAGQILGLDLSPALENWQEIAGLVAEADAYEASRDEAHLLVRMTRRRIREHIAALPDTLDRDRFTADLDALDRELAPRLRRTAALEDLTAYRMALLAFEDRIGGSCGDLASAVEVEQGPLEETDRALTESSAGSCGEVPEDASHRPRSGDDKSTSYFRRTGTVLPPPIQPIQPSCYESCNAGANAPTYDRTSANADEAKFLVRPEGREERLETKRGGADSAVNPTLRARLTPQVIRDEIVSEDFGMYLDALDDTDEAILFMLRELGINATAWEDAVSLMGWYDAFLSLCVIDRNRFHPETPVISPGGTLRRFTDLHRQGQLHLTRSILSILERHRAGQQSRKHSRARPDA